MSGDAEGPRVRKRASVGAAAGAGASGAAAMLVSGTLEDSRRTTRAASKRAAIDDTARVAFPAAGVQQAKKRAALANLSNHSSLPSSRNSSPVADANTKKRAALANLSNHPSIPAARNAVHGSKAGVAAQAGGSKSKSLGASTQPRNADSEFVAPQKREKVPLAEKPSRTFLGSAPVATDCRENLENVAPARGAVDEVVHASSSRAEVDALVKVNNVPALLPTKVHIPPPLSDAAVIESLERKTLENLYISRNSKTALPQEVDWSSSPSYTDIDSDYADPQMCSSYAIDIYQHLRMQEVKRRPTTEFMEALQQDINASMRGILIDWLVEVAEEYKLVPDTLYLTVSYIDRFLSCNVVNRQRLQLLGVSCMLIAAKYEEICAPQVEEFCYITDNTYARNEVLEMERRVLTNLHFELTTPTTKSFLRRFIRAAQAGYSVPALQLEFLGNYLAELTLVEYNFLHYLPSVVAASAVFVARLTLDGEIYPWNATLQHYTGYRASDLKECVTEIHELQCNSRNCTLPAIREKYSQHKFKCVATLTPASKIPQEYFEDIGS